MGEGKGGEEAVDHHKQRQGLVVAPEEEGKDTCHHNQHQRLVAAVDEEAKDAGHHNQHRRLVVALEEEEKGAGRHNSLVKKGEEEAVIPRLQQSRLSVALEEEAKAVETRTNQPQWSVLVVAALKEVAQALFQIGKECRQSVNAAEDNLEA